MSTMAAITSLFSAASEPDGEPARGVLSFPPFRLDLNQERLSKGDEELHLRRKPFSILRYLAQHPRRLVTHDELVLAFWGQVAMSESVLRSHIHALRQVLGEGIIETVLGRGYRLLADVRETGSFTAQPPGDDPELGLSRLRERVAVVRALMDEIDRVARSGNAESLGSQLGEELIGRRP
jgi:DNA-binding winged helix-turn-helix (wHTH) protein